MAAQLLQGREKLKKSEKKGEKEKKEKPVFSSSLSPGPKANGHQTREAWRARVRAAFRALALRWAGVRLRAALRAIWLRSPAVRCRATRRVFRPIAAWEAACVPSHFSARGIPRARV